MAEQQEHPENEPESEPERRGVVIGREPGPEVAAQLAALDEDALWWEVIRRMQQQEENEEEDEEGPLKPGWGARWELPVLSATAASSSDRQKPLELAPAEVLAVLDAVQVSRVLRRAGLPDCRCPNSAAGGPVVIAAPETALVYAWGPLSWPRRHGPTTVETLLEVYQRVLEATVSSCVPTGRRSCPDGACAAPCPAGASTAATSSWSWRPSSAASRPPPGSQTPIGAVGLARSPQASVTPVRARPVTGPWPARRWSASWVTWPRPGRASPGCRPAPSCSSWRNCPLANPRRCVH